MTEIRLIELLCSKLCHDLVGPIGAIGNGMELLEDEELGMAKEAMDLTAQSTRRASAILQFYRIAYGLGQSERRQDPNYLFELAAGVVKGSRVALDWPAEARAKAWPEGSGKLILNMIVLAQEALPTGGTVQIGIAEDAAGAEITATALGRDAGLNEATQEALSDAAAPETLTPRNVHGYFTKLLCQRVGGRLEVSAPAADTLRVASRVAVQEEDLPLG